MCSSYVSVSALWLWMWSWDFRVNMQYENKRTDFWPFFWKDIDFFPTLSCFVGGVCKVCNPFKFILSWIKASISYKFWGLFLFIEFLLHIYIRKWCHYSSTLLIWEAMPVWCLWSLWSRSHLCSASHSPIIFHLNS